MAKSKKNKNKAKLNLTVRDEQRNKLEQMASLENRSVSNLIEVMADERWKRLAEQQGVAYAKTVAEAMKLKLDMDNPADREKLRRAVLDLVAGRKTPSEKALPSVVDCYFHHRMNFPRRVSRTAVKGLFFCTFGNQQIGKDALRHSFKSDMMLGK